MAGVTSLTPEACFAARRIEGGATQLHGLREEQMSQTLHPTEQLVFPDSQAPPSNMAGYRPLDILIVTSEAPPIVSGISTCVDRLGRGLAHRGHRVTVLSAVEIPRLVLGEWRLSSLVAHWRGIAHTLRHLDVVNVHGPIPTMSDVFLGLLHSLPRHVRPAVVYTHHSPIDIPRVARMSAMYNKLHRSLALGVDWIVATSDYYANQHRHRYGPPVAVVPWGVDEQGQGSPPPRARQPSADLHALFVGQMRPYKGVETLLAAAAGQPWLKLTLVGGGHELPNYRRLAERLSATNARFMGRISDAELHDQYMSNDAVVLPSVTQAEAFGLVLLEGMAAGCVPVTSDLPGVRDLVGPTGLVVPPGDPDSLREALRTLACDVARREDLQHASWLAAQRFTWERCVRSYERVLLQAALSHYARLHGIAMLPELSGLPAKVPSMEYL